MSAVFHGIPKPGVVACAAGLVLTCMYVRTVGLADFVWVDSAFQLNA